jgi:hypothetical protein
MQTNSKTQKLSVKWGKENYSLEVNLSTVGELKSLLSQKTLVEPNRQKLFFKGKVLDDTYSLTNIADGSLLTMTGTASMDSAININTDKKVVFLEDLSNEEKAKMMREKGEDLVFGLQNLGNTCYLNSCMQVLSHTLPLNNFLKTDYLNKINEVPDSILLIEWNKLRDLMWSENCTIAPNGFLNAIRK